MQVDLNSVTLGLIQDLEDLRANKITNTDARVRAQLAREIMRSMHLYLEGLKTIQSANVQRLENKPDEQSDGN